jgi:hypothetical protein
MTRIHLIVVCFFQTVVEFQQRISLTDECNSRRIMFILHRMPYFYDIVPLLFDSVDKLVCYIA